MLYCIQRADLRVPRKERRGEQNRLEALRKERGIRQEELAKAPVRLAADDRLAGKRRYNPSILLAFRIARYFDLPIEEIFLYDEQEDTL